MKALKNIGICMLLGAITAGLMLAAAPARALDFAPETLKTVDEIILKMQQETMQKQFAAMPIKDELPARMMSNMYQYASNNYRAVIQPQMVQVIISQMRPWDFPDKFKQRMMPDIVAQMSNQIKTPQLQQMQEGIMDASFPVTYLPMGPQEGGGQTK